MGQEQDTLLQSPYTCLHIHKVIAWLIEGMVQKILFWQTRPYFENMCLLPFVRMKKLASKRVKEHKNNNTCRCLLGAYLLKSTRFESFNETVKSITINKIQKWIENGPENDLLTTV